LIAVRNDVIDATKSKQIPWEHSALRGRFYFNVPAQTTGVVAPLAPRPQPSEASEEWSRLDKSSIVELGNILEPTWLKSGGRLRESQVE
jgi:hypothetical protein